ncbi:hypothetical protein PENSTE_c005G04678 [Penicillium steckii]|uniref:protein S-acyltransferase n=1 Tax=Penicillium steckii TaxID=303698 RepID=A0A1V6TJ91_9EURO|nr:hypothetical protein PENSTE_c005G04678 [Penicillium steckii]
MAALLISQHAAVHALFRGSTALVVAAAERHLDIVKLLLEEGALIDAPSSIYGTALMAATFRGHVKLVKFLLENGANVNAIGSQYSTAPHTAVVVGKREIAKILLDAGADINALDKNYCSPLHLAASLGHAEIVRLLLLRGSSNIITHIHPTYGSPLEAVYASSNFHAAKILVEFGANDSTYSLSDIQKGPPTSRATCREISGRENKKVIDESADMAVPSGTTSSTDSKHIPNQFRSMEKQCITRSSRPSHRDEFKIAIICALSIEADAVEALLDRCWDKDGEPYGKATGDTNAYTTGMLGRHNVILVYMPGIGKGSASSVATNIRNSYQG